MTAGSPRVAVVGAGFTGLAASWQLTRLGIGVTLYEASAELGGLASTFQAGGQSVERFYHHWFVSDREVLEFAEELGLGESIVVRPTRTAVYQGNRRLRLSTPWDLLRFKPLSFIGRLRLARLMLTVRRLRDWSSLEDRTAKDWLLEIGGPEVYRVVWEPLLQGKFGQHAERISAVWMWNKLKLRGGSRGRRGEEQLAYLSGGFSRLSDAVATRLVADGGELRLGSRVSMVRREANAWVVESGHGSESFDAVLVTTAPALAADMVAGWADPPALAALRRIEYLGNLCLVLELDRALSDTYWLSVNDPDFPFVGVIEHTNFENASSYGGRHVVYLSRYLATDDPLWTLADDDVLEFAWGHLSRMHPQLQRSWLQGSHVWRARWAQPIVESGYRRMIPPQRGQWPGFYLASMAQIYPEDRGTNQAVREGRRIAHTIAHDLAPPTS